MLVVDDNATNRRIFEKTLEKWNMRPTLVDNGPDALIAVREAERARRSVQAGAARREHARHGRLHGGASS